MKVQLLLLICVHSLVTNTFAQGVQRNVLLHELSTTRLGLKEFQLGNFTSQKVQIVGRCGYLSQIPEGFDGEELNLMIYPGASMRIAHNAYPNSRQNIFTKSGMDLYVPRDSWVSAGFVYDSTLDGGRWMLDYISTSYAEQTIGGAKESATSLSAHNIPLRVFPNQNGAMIGYIQSLESELPPVVNVYNTGRTYLSGIAQGSDGQKVTLILNRGRGSWRMLHNYNGTFCYGCASAAGFVPKLPENIKPLVLENDEIIGFYNSLEASATFRYDANLNGGSWVLVRWSSVR